MLTGLLITARAAHIAASILIAGSFTFDLAVLGSSPSDNLNEVRRWLFPLVTWSLVTALVSALFWFWLEVSNMSGSPLAKAFSGTAWQTVLLGTEFGRVWQLRLALIALVFAIIGLRRREVRRARVFILWLLSVVFLTSLAWISHAAAAQVQPIGVFGDALHLCAAGMWIGGLVPLAIFLTHIPRAFLSLETGAVVLRRFSTISLCCVSVLIISGVSNSWLLVGSIHALFTTAYGQLLLLKLALFGILISLGARNRLAIQTKLSGSHPGSELMLQVRRNVICEACLGAAVVAIVACLGVTPPSAASMMDKFQTYHAAFPSPTTR
jgi:putative copper resistance protein D